MIRDGLTLFKKIIMPYIQIQIYAHILRIIVFSVLYIIQLKLLYKIEMPKQSIHLPMPRTGPCRYQEIHYP